MAIISPVNLNKWKPGTTISSTEAKAEFLNVYNAINGNLDATNLRNGSITGIKIQDGSITADKLSSIPASKIEGKLKAENLPANIMSLEGGTLTGTIMFDVQPKTPLLKNYDNEEITLYEGGTGEQKIKVIVGGEYVFSIRLNDRLLWAVNSDGVAIPTKFKVPGS